MVDFNKKIRNSSKFCQAAKFFLEHGCYTLAPRGTTDYIKYWDRETERCLNGYVADDGDSITGYHYFYLNYSPIMKLEEVEYTDRYGNKRTRRERKLNFPNFWDYDKYYFDAIDQAEEEGKHMAVLKSRQRGYSFKGASMLVRNYELIPGSKNFAVASELKFLIGDGLLTKAWLIMDFIDKNTAWSKQRLVSTRMERVSGFKTTDEFGKQTELGYLSSISGRTLKNDPERLRGTRGKLILFEEGGKFPNLETAWRVEQPAVETDDGVAFGLLIAFGCVCKGTRVWTCTGDCVNIEDLSKDEGILGWDTYLAVKLKISHMNPPAEKPCVRITTTSGRTLECSTDHPLLWSKPGFNKRVPGKRLENEYMKSWLFHEAGKCKVGEQVGVINNIPFFGTKEMWEPRLVGWLIGDGSYGYDKTPRLSNCDDEINNYVLTHFDTSDDCKPRITKNGKLYRETRIKGICPKLRELGIYGQTKTAKRLPDHIHQYDAKSLAELIGGIFDTDGYMTIDSSGRPRITLTQNNKEILQQISEVLLHFEVHCSIKFIKTKNRIHKSNGRVIKDGEGHWRLTVSDITSIGNFVRNIDSVVSYKQSAMDAMHLFTESHISRHHKYVSGIHAERITKIEDIGMLPIYNLTADCNHNYIANGIVTHNTGGTEGGSFDGLKNLFYNPKAFNVLSFPNIWDDGQELTECGFFVPSWSNMEGVDSNGNKLMDEDGNSLKDLAIEELIRQRNIIKDGGATQQSIDRFISERPLKPQEAVLELGKNIFPRKLLMDQLTRIRTNTKLKNMKHIVDLSWDGDGRVKAIEKKSGDITTYHLKKDDKPEGSVVIWEYPITDPPFGLYIAGCLTPGEKVCTQRGLVNVEEVGLDDKLINKDGNFVKINTLLRYNKEDEDVYTVKVSNFNRTTTFTAEHPLYTWSPIRTKQHTIDWDKQDYKFNRMKFVQVGDFVQIPNVYYNTNDSVYTPFETKDFWWFVGLWLGDGWCDKDGYKIYIAFDVNQIEYFEKCKSFVEQQLGRSIYSRIRGGSIELSFCCKDLNRWLTTTFGKYAYGKHIPDNIKRISRLKKLQLLRGYLDSDGCVYINQKYNIISLEWVSVSQVLLEDIQDICFGVGITSSLSKLRDKKEEFILGRRVQQCDTYHLRTSTAQSATLVDMMLEDCDYTDIKLNKVKKCGIHPKLSTPRSCFLTNDNTTIVTKIVQIKVKKYTGIVYNFDCDTHTFMCRGILTHNCDPLTQSQAGLKSSKNGETLEQTTPC